MRVLVVLEGKHERAGAMENLIKRLGGDKADLEFDRVSNNAVHAWNGTGPGHFKRALGWLKEAERRGIDALIFLIDDDQKKEERRSKQITDAQNFEGVSRLPRGMGVAIRTFDAWMLADEKVLSDVLGCVVARQSEPETIRDPKQVCAGLLTNGQNQMAQSEMYARIAQRLDVAVLVSRCPSGFRPFAERVTRVFGHGPRMKE
jgi:hypothetical protein